MRYEAFAQKALKEVRKRVFDDRIDETEVVKRPYKKRFSVELDSTTGLDKDPQDRLFITDKNSLISCSEINTYNKYLRIKSGELTKKEALDEVVNEAEAVVQRLIVATQHQFDKIIAQKAFDKANGIKADYEHWYE